MRFGIDLDGVVADCTSALVREINEKWPGRLPVGYQQTDWDWNPEIGREDLQFIWSIVYKKHNWWLSLPPCFDNVRAIATHRVRHPEDEIFYVTARKPTAGMPVMHQSQTWLSSCGIGGLGTAVIVDASGDKASIFNALECDANIDDKLEGVINHVNESRGAYLLSRPWNIKGRPAGIPVVENLNEFFKVTRRRHNAAGFSQTS